MTVRVFVVVVATLGSVACPAIAGNPAPAPVEPVVAVVPSPHPSSARWNGFYVGAGVGGVFLDGERSSSDLPDNDFDSEGVSLHGLIGWNHQVGDLVFGIEGEIGYADDDENFVVSGNGFDVGSDFTFAARVRAGRAFDRLFVYLAGGLAGADYEVNDIGFGRDSGTLLGWTAGVGAEYAFGERLAVRGEVNYIDYGSEGFNAGTFVDKIELDGFAPRISLILSF